MLTDDDAIKLKRLRGARGYFQCWPEERVCPGLLRFVAGPEILQFSNAYGFDALECDAVACLAGILYTLPEFKDWLREQGLRGPCPSYLTEFFGVHLWGIRYVEEGSGTDKEVALRRLDRAIAALEEKGGKQ